MSVLSVARMVLLMSLMVLGVSAAWAECVAPEMRTDIRPHADAGPTEITASFLVIDVLSINDLEQNIELDMRGIFTWNDPRLEGLEGCRFGLGEVWFPPVILINSSNLREHQIMARNQVRIEEGGKVIYNQRYTGTVSSYHQLHRFPFDAHVISLDLTAPDYRTDELMLRADAEATGLASRLNIEGWTIHRVGLVDLVDFAPVLGRDISVLSLEIEASRNPVYYLFRVLLPLSFVVAMSWVIFWVPPERFEFQIGLGATAMLTAIAFSLSIAGQLPDLGYLTTLDKMLIWAIFMVFLSMVEALVAGLLVLRERADAAHRLDRVARVFMPLLMLLGWGGFWLAL